MIRQRTGVAAGMPYARGGHAAALATPGGACPECAGPIMLDGRRAERFCVACGLVVEENVIVPWKVVSTDRGNDA